MKNVIKNLAILFVLFFGLCLFILSNQIGGWRTFIVKSGSMEPQIPTGALVISKYTHPTHLKQQDIITFISPSKDRAFITHRITKITNNEGHISLKTKGDNNKAEDDWDIAGGSVVGKVTYRVPYIGYVMTFAQNKLGILLFILIPSIYILIEEINSLFTLLRKKRPESSEAPTVMIILILLGTFLLSSRTTYAFLSDSISLTNNTFTVVIPTLAPPITPIYSTQP